MFLDILNILDKFRENCIASVVLEIHKEYFSFPKKPANDFF